MKLSLFVFLLLGAYLAAAQPRTARIAGGAAAATGAHRHAVALRRYDGRPGFFEHWAGGFLVTVRHIVSTAAVFQPEFRTNPVFWRVRVGSLLRETGGSLVTISSVVIHPDFELASREADIAVVVLAEALADTVDAAPISVPPQDFAVPPGVPVTVVGWGRVSYDGDHAETLQTAVLSTIDTSLCAQLYANHVASTGIWGPTVSTRMLCAAGTPATCEGDNGGPVTIGDVAVGVISWGRSCAGLNLPSVFVDLASFTNWLQVTVAAT